MLGHTTLTMLLTRYYRYVPNLTRQDGKLLAANLERTNGGPKWMILTRRDQWCYAAYIYMLASRWSEPIRQHHVSTGFRR